MIRSCAIRRKYYFSLRRKGALAVGTDPLPLPSQTSRLGRHEYITDEYTSRRAVASVFSYCSGVLTEMWLRLSLVKGSRFQSLQRSRKVIPDDDLDHEAAAGFQLRCGRYRCQAQERYLTGPGSRGSSPRGQRPLARTVLAT